MAVSVAAKKWTLEELHSLPDDGNKYELIHGDLFVTPAPKPIHELIAARLNHRLVPYVESQRLGLVWRPRAVFRFEGSEVEPDLMVVPDAPFTSDWALVPKPILIVEILSPTTRRRDHEHKREFYLESGIPEYWIVDPDAHTVRVVLPGQSDTLATTTLTWSPRDSSQPLLIALADLFADLK